MKKTIPILLFLTFFVFFRAQSAKEIIDKNIENTGGLTQWKLLNSVIINGKVILGIKESYPIKILQQRPNLSKTILFINNKETAIEGYDGKKGFGMNYATNQLQEYENYIPESFDNDFIDWEKKGFEAKLLGKEKINNGLCYKIELTKNVNKNYYYFDVQTFLLIKEEKKEEVLLYSDYRKIGKLLMPYRIESSNPNKNGDYVMLINTIQINKEIPLKAFGF